MKPAASFIRELRRSKGLTQQQIADMLGITHGGYIKYEHGTVTPPADKLAKLADLFGVSTDYLLGREPEPVDWATVRKSEPMMLRSLCQTAFSEALAAAGDDVGKLKALWERVSKQP